MPTCIGKDQLPIVEVLRLGHRPERDKRITTHVALVARAFGARAIHVDKKDSNLEDTISRLNDQFGGDFSINSGASRRRVISRWKGTIVHLTMYGMPLDQAIAEIPSNENILVIVGAEKVPRDVYDLSHFNVSIGNQPHSEVSALALFLDRLFRGEELENQINGGKMRILPNKKGKTVLPNEDETSVVQDPFSRKWPPIPGKEECMELLNVIGCSRPVLAHTQAVCELGLEMVRTSREEHSERDLDIDDDILLAGLLLHDIGRSVTHSINHVTQGATIGERLGLNTQIIDMIHNHIGAGLTSSEASSLGLPEEDHIPKNLMERIITHADNLVGNRQRRPLCDAVDGLRSKGADEGADRMIRLHEQLEKELGIDIDLLVPKGRSLV